MVYALEKQSVKEPVELSGAFEGCHEITLNQEGTRAFEHLMCRILQRETESGNTSSFAPAREEGNFGARMG